MTTYAQVPTCLREGCTRPLTGRQEKYCSTACRVAAWHEAKYVGRTAEDLLSGLPQKELRGVIRRVCERRWSGKRGRLKVRFGAPWMEPGGPGAKG